MTVSLALRNRPEISAETRTRIQKIARDLGYTPDATLHALMDQVRTQKPQGFQALIAVLHMVPRQFAEETPSYMAWLKGACARGAALGYQLDDFWLADTTLNGVSLERTLTTRNARGLLLPCWPNTSALPSKLFFLLEHFPSATIGYPPASYPPMPGAKNDHFATGTALFQKAVQAGSRRIGLVLLNEAEPAGDERFAAAVSSAVRYSPDIVLLPILHLEDSNVRIAFLAWLKEHRPDCIITTAPRVRAWLDEAGEKVPDEIRFLYWQVGEDTPGWSGMCQNESEVGAAALDLIVAQLHLGRAGPATTIQCKTLVPSTWVEGTTLCKDQFA